MIKESSQGLFIVTWFCLGIWHFWNHQYKDGVIAFSISYVGASKR